MGQGVLSSSIQPIEEVRKHLLELPYVTIGRRFGGEAFFYRKRFFCHFHPTRDHFFLETFVWNKLDEVTKQIPGVIPHPEYGNYGWTRLPIFSEKDAFSGIELVDKTYRYLRTTRRMSIQKDEFSFESLENVRSKIRPLEFEIKESKKRMQILMQIPDTTDYDKAEKLLSKAAKMLKP